MQIRQGNGRLKRLSVNLIDQVHTGIDICTVYAALRIVKPEKMFRAAVRMPSVRFRSLSPSGISCTQRSGKGRILSVGFRLPAHSGIPGDVQHRRENLCDAERQLLSGHDRADLLLQLRIKRRAAVHAGRKTGAVLNERAAQSLHMEDGRDMMFAALHDHRLQPLLPRGRLLRSLAHPEPQCADLTHAVGNKVPECILPALESHHTDDLAHLFVQTHPRKKILRPLLGRQRRIEIFHTVSCHVRTLHKKKIS